jgi:hypothetical protein
MLAGHPESATFVSEYAELRCSGTPIEQALVSVGHEEQLREPESAPIRRAGRGRPGRRSRPCARGGELLLSARLGEAVKHRQKGHRSMPRVHDAQHCVRISENAAWATFDSRAGPRPAGKEPARPAAL